MFKIASFMLLITFASGGCADRSWKLRETNDYFTLLNDDHGYTQGLELSTRRGRDTLGIGQDIYTPEHKRERIPRRDERPYAGYLYAFWERVDGDYTYTVRPGWIGPHALGKDAQCGVHLALGQDCPAGWPEQISDRPTLEASVGKADVYEGFRILYRADLGSPKTRLLAAVETVWHVGSNTEISAGPRLEAIAHDEFLEAGESTVRKRPYRAAMELSVRCLGVRYFLATETSAIKESGDAYNYGGLEFTW